MSNGIHRKPVRGVFPVEHQLLGPLSFCLPSADQKGPLLPGADMSISPETNAGPSMLNNRASHLSLHATSFKIEDHLKKDMVP